MPKRKISLWKNPRDRFPAWSGKCRLYSKALGKGTSRLYKIWKKADKERAAEAEEAAAKKSAVEEAEEDRGLAAVLSAVEFLQEKMDLLLEGQA